jgi:GntR family transcriptional regulator
MVVSWPRIPMDMIDKGLPIPYHYQLREILRQEVVTGRWPINEKLPSERELCDRKRFLVESF